MATYRMNIDPAEQTTTFTVLERLIYTSTSCGLSNRMVEGDSPDNSSSGKLRRMKKIFLVLLILHAVIFSSCVERSETHVAWEKINSAMPEPQMVEKSHNDSVIDGSISSLYQLADRVRTLFKEHRSKSNDYFSLQVEINDLEGMPQKCAETINRILAEKTKNDTISLALLDSTEVVIIECIFDDLIKE